MVYNELDPFIKSSALTCILTLCSSIICANNDVYYSFSLKKSLNFVIDNYSFSVFVKLVRTLVKLFSLSFISCKNEITWIQREMNSFKWVIDLRSATSIKSLWAAYSLTIDTLSIESGLSSVKNLLFWCYMPIKLLSLDLRKVWSR